MVVLVLVVLWIAVLTPRLVRHFREGRSHYSIESFHEQLHLLGRTGPKLVEPAYRLEVPDTDPLAPSLAPSLAVVDGSGVPHATPRLVRGVRQKQSSWERRRSRRRRRDVLFSLMGLAVVTGGLGALHALHLLWAITGVSALALAGYVALVAYAQMLHADRDAARPIAGQPSTRPPSLLWDAPGPRQAPARSTPAAVAVLSASSPLAARAGYPGAWDDDGLVAVGPRHAASGV